MSKIPFQKPIFNHPQRMFGMFFRVVFFIIVQDAELKSMMVQIQRSKILTFYKAM
jgi:hypothetical protein